MQRIKFDTPINEEWTKYFVNGIECKRDNIYKIIIDNKFYTGKINLTKKYHFQIHEARTIRDTFGFHTKTMSHDEHNNRNASFSLDTGEFVKKINPESDKYKVLVNKMIHTLDMFYEAQQNYREYSLNFRIAIVNCMGFLIENVMDFEAPYNNILYKCSLEYFSFLFDMLAFGLSQSEKASGELKIPSVEFDMSSMNEKWDEHWTHSQKSQFLNKYLSIMIKQADVVGSQWMKSGIFFGDKSCKNDIKNKFNVFKKNMQCLLKEKKSLDVSLHLHPSLTSKIAGFFHFSNPTSDVAENQQAHNLRVQSHS